MVISSGPGHQRTVAAVKADAGPFLSVVAVSPSGQEVLLDEQRFAKGGGEDFARLVRVRDGRTLASVRVAEKSGFTREGTLRRAGLEDDGLHDQALFALLDDEVKL